MDVYLKILAPERPGEDGFSWREIMGRMSIKISSFLDVRGIRRRLPDLRRKIYVRPGLPPAPVLAKERANAIKRWHLRVDLELPDMYENLCSEGSYLAAFLLISNLLEFHITQKLLGLGLEKEQSNILTLAKRLGFLPGSIVLTIIRIRLKLSNIKTPAYYVENLYTLGDLIKEGKRLGVSEALIKKLRNFNGKRCILIHNLCQLENANLDINRKCKEACELANDIWNQLRSI